MLATGGGPEGDDSVRGSALPGGAARAFASERVDDYLVAIARSQARIVRALTARLGSRAEAPKT